MEKEYFSSITNKSKIVDMTPEETKKYDERLKHNCIFAEALGKALRKFAEHPERLENFESYLSHHFDVWYKQYANTMENLVYEFENFSDME